MASAICGSSCRSCLKSLAPIARQRTSVCARTRAERVASGRAARARRRTPRADLDLGRSPRPSTTAVPPGPRRARLPGRRRARGSGRPGSGARSRAPARAAGRCRRAPRRAAATGTARARVRSPRRVHITGARARPCPRAARSTRRGRRSGRRAGSGARAPADERRAGRVQLVELAGKPPRGQEPLEHVPEADEEAGADQRR